MKTSISDLKLINIFLPMKNRNSSIWSYSGGFNYIFTVKGCLVFPSDAAVCCFFYLFFTCTFLSISYKIENQLYVLRQDCLFLSKKPVKSFRSQLPNILKLNLTSIKIFSFFLDINVLVLSSSLDIEYFMFNQNKRYLNKSK